MHDLGVVFLLEHFIASHGQPSDVLVVLKTLAGLRGRELLAYWRRNFIFQANSSFHLISIGHQIFAFRVSGGRRRRDSRVQVQGWDLQFALGSITRRLLQVLVQERLR